jgi:hexosaminidase
MKNMALALLFGLALQAQTVSKLGASGYAVIPEPQEVELQSGVDLRFGPVWSLQSGPGVASGDIAQDSLRDLLKERFGLNAPANTGTLVRLEIQPGSITPGKATGADKRAIADQAYRLETSPAGVTITANASEGLFYGVQTLVQLLRPRNGTLSLPQGRITDWPDLPWRHIYWDDAHHLDRLPELKRAVRQASFFKINGFSIKLEGHFQFKSAPALVEPYAMTPAEYQVLTDYALRYHVQLIPYIDGPGHIAFILKHPEYAKYRSFPDSNYELCAVNPEAVKLLSGMFQDLVDANRGGKFVYLSTDEAYYIGLADNPECREKTAAESLGSVGKLLAQFITKVANPLHEQGRTVIFWGEYPLKPADIAALPAHLINGEVYGPDFDPVFRKHGIRQMIYTSTQGGESRFFPDYFSLPNARRLHPVPSQIDRLADGFREISYQPARSQAELQGAVVAGWADMGLHTETFWLGYATITAAGWHPGSPSVPESASAFYRLFYGDGAVNMDRVYQLMSQQSHFWLDSWEWGTSLRKPIFGYSYGIYNPKQAVRDQALDLPPAPGADLQFDASWTRKNERKLALSDTFLAENDELLGLLHENLRTISLNRYNLEVYVSIAQLYRQNLEMLRDLGRINYLLESAQKAAGEKNAKQAIESLDRALQLAKLIRQQRNTALRDATATWEKSWFPRVLKANGRTFLHDLDDVKDHVPDRTVDNSYLVQRELALPFGAWVEAIRASRNQYARSNGIPLDTQAFDWLDMGDHPVIAGIPGE